jgi:hypothetical protein
MVGFLHERDVGREDPTRRVTYKAEIWLPAKKCCSSQGFTEPRICFPVVEPISECLCCTKKLVEIIRPWTDRQMNDRQLDRQFRSLSCSTLRSGRMSRLVSSILKT